MKVSKIKKLCAVALAVAISASVFVGCGSDDSAGGSNQKLLYNVGAVVETIDPALNTAVDGSTIIGNAFEGLVRLDDKDKAIPGVAEKWEISEDGKTYTFHLRENAKWSDGQPVKASDFEYAWKRVLNKDTASEYAYQLFYLKNGEEYYNGKAKADDVGVKAKDDKTLEVKINTKTPYFLELMAFPTYMPVRKDIVEANGDKWTQKPETFVTNGPFKLEDYQMKDSYKFVKNDNYWNKDAIKLEELTYKMATDSTSSYASLESGDFDMVGVVPTERMEDGKEKGLVQTFANLGTYFVCLNVGNNTDKLPADVKKALSNKDVRHALALAIDREAIVKDVTKGGQVPSADFVPAGIQAPDGKDFKQNKFDPTKFEDNVAEAKKLLEKAGYKDGKGLPTFKLMYNSEGDHKSVMEVIQQNWKKIGVNVELTNQEWAVFLNTRQKGEYEISRHGWSADYVDPMTFLDMWVSGEDGKQATWGNNDAHFSNKKYDELVKKAKTESDPAKRFEYMRQADDVLMDEMPIIPLYDYTKTYGIQPYVKGLHVSPLGQIYFDKVEIQK